MKILVLVISAVRTHKKYGQLQIYNQSVERPYYDVLRLRAIGAAGCLVPSEVTPNIQHPLAHTKKESP